MVEIGSDGSIRRMGGFFLLPTLPLWQAQGVAVAVLCPPNGISVDTRSSPPASAARDTARSRARPQSNHP
jgi:hypothetical protein